MKRKGTVYMEPQELGRKYDRIAQWWHEQHHASAYGMQQLARALSYASTTGRRALDVGCGAGGRVVNALLEQGYEVAGIDVSAEMVRLAARNHPDAAFHLQDICTWEPGGTFDFIVAWDSIFHLPLQMQRPVMDKLCRLLNKNGVIIYSFGNATGDHTDTWHGDEFYYSSIGMNDNLTVLLENGLAVLHLELDQFPEQRHAYIIARKL